MSAPVPLRHKGVRFCQIDYDPSKRTNRRKAEGFIGGFYLCGHHLTLVLAILHDAHEPKPRPQWAQRRPSLTGSVSSCAATTAQTD